MVLFDPSSSLATLLCSRNIKCVLCGSYIEEHASRGINYKQYWCRHNDCQDI